MKTRMLFFVALAMPLLGLCAEDSDDFRVGARPDTTKGPKEFLPEVYRDVARRMAKLPAPLAEKPGPNDVPGANWENNDDAKGFIKDARNVPELYGRILIPPGFPNAVAEAKADVRLRAAAVLGQTHDRRALDPLVNSSIYDPDEHVRYAASKALRLLEEPVALRKLCDIAVARDFSKYPWGIRKSACAAIRRYGDKEAVERMLKELSYELAGGNPLDSKNRIRGRASGIATDNPIGMPDPGPNVQLPETDCYPVLSAVKEVTGMSFDKGEKDMKSWFVWWNKDGTKFAFKD